MHLLLLRFRYFHFIFSNGSCSINTLGLSLTCVGESPLPDEDRIALCEKIRNIREEGKRTINRTDLDVQQKRVERHRLHAVLT